MKILLVEPNFPISTKSKNHKDFLPIGLLKIASFLRDNNHEIKLFRSFSNNLDLIRELEKFNPNEIWVTSLFTYWSKYVKESVEYYKALFPKSRIIVGGIYASLMPEHCKKYSGCDDVHIGLYKEAEIFFPAYDLVDVDYQILHTSRGCIRKCKFCGTYKIEPKFYSKRSIKDEIRSNKLIFYDNNLLANKFIDNILNELIGIKFGNKSVYCECQSGFDGRILTKELALKLKLARFLNPRIAWDNSYEDYSEIESQIGILIEAGYEPKEIYIFMIYNYATPFKIMEQKRKKCFNWGVQISDCRYRPLNCTFDNYNPYRINQDNNEYFIHEKWTDREIKLFRKNVRRQNICIRHDFPFYSSALENKIINNKILDDIKKMDSLSKKIQYLDKYNIDYWIPNGE